MRHVTVTDVNYSTVCTDGCYDIPKNMYVHLDAIIRQAQSTGQDKVENSTKIDPNLMQLNVE